MNRSRANFDQLIPEMREWNNGRGIDIESRIGCGGHFRHVIGYSVIFWSRFVEFGQYVRELSSKR